ncbi:hypothetical protein [Streptomyces sp. Ag109_O5-10]|uniref:hypothetical protein n=1 Tax=Streptomyces sp. Ag109_O5-10 TaxID=1855349 RepID=UPI0035248724
MPRTASQAETSSLSYAKEVRAFAEKEGDAWVSMWSTFRDVRCESGAASRDDAATNCTGVKQSSGAFGEAFADWALCAGR